MWPGLFGPNASHSAANFKTGCGKWSTCDQTVQCLFLKFCSWDTSLEIQGGNRRPSANWQSISENTSQT